MPSKATLFNCKCDPVYDFGTGHRNMVHFNPQGSNILTTPSKELYKSLLMYVTH